MTTTLTEAPTTGLRYDAGKLQWHLMDYKAMEPMIQVLMYGAKKYTVELDDGTVVPGDHNWKKGMALEKILDCMQRHVADLMAGETIDKESGLPIIGHVLCNAMFYSHFMLKELELQKLSTFLNGDTETGRWPLDYFVLDGRPFTKADQDEVLKRRQQPTGTKSNPFGNPSAGIENNI